MNLDLIPEIKNDLDVAFSTQRTNPNLLALARDKGFYNGKTKYNDMFSDLFFSGGKINVKSGISEPEKIKILRYFKAIASSFEPKYEEKEAVCALLLSWVCD